MLTKTIVKCPECGLATGGDTGIDPEIHLADCFHIIRQPVKSIIERLTNATQTRSLKIKAYAQAILDAEPTASQPDTPDMESAEI